MARIAIVGTGISGLGAAWLLHTAMRSRFMRRQAGSAGTAGRSRSIMMAAPIPVDTGFIVFNKPNYPNLTGLVRASGRAGPQKRYDLFGLHPGRLAGMGRLQDLDTIFGQRRNLLRPALRAADTGCDEVQQRGRSARWPPSAFHPRASSSRSHGAWANGSGASICCRWRARSGRSRAEGDAGFPARTLVQFFLNHHLMSVRGQPQWYTVTGGAQEYVRRLTAFAHRIRTGCGAQAISCAMAGRSRSAIRAAKPTSMTTW